MKDLQDSLNKIDIDNYIRGISIKEFVEGLLDIE